MTFEQMKEKLASMLTEHRYTHSLGVVKMAEEMAERFCIDTKKARIAALLHDCAKQIDYETQLAMCMERKLEIDETKRENGALLHAELGAELAKTEFFVEDPEILGAIRYHTLGRAAMTDLEKILYLSDMAEPNRKPYEGLEELRALCKQDLDTATLFGLELSIAHIGRKGRMLHTQTIEAEAYLRNLLHKEVYTMEPLTPLEKATKAVKILDAKKAHDIKLLKVSGLTILADYFIICSAGSTTQVRALADHVEEELTKAGESVISREGRQGMNWILLDYGDVILHIFHQETREFYNLEKLWDDAESLNIQDLINE